MKKPSADKQVLDQGASAGHVLAQDIPGPVEVERTTEDEPCELGVLRLSVDSVCKVQQALQARSHTIQPRDGTVNEATRRAIKGVQREVRSRQTGELDITVLHALGFEVAVGISDVVQGGDLARSRMLREDSGAPFEVARSIDVEIAKGKFLRQSLSLEMPRGTKLITRHEHEPLGCIVLGPEELQAVQAHLKRGKFFAGDTNGAVSAELIEAIRAFQTAKGLPATGMIDAPTLTWIPQIRIRVEVAPKHA